MKISLIAAQTIDGFIARNSTEFASWTSKDDKRHFVTKTKEAKVMILGSKTFSTFPKPLPERVHIIYSRNPEAYAQTLLKKFGWEKLPEEIQVTNAPVKELIADLESKGYEEAMICGGSEIYTLFLTAGVVSTAYITIEPVFFGAGISLCTSPIDSLSFTLRSIEKTEGGTLFLEYTVSKKEIQ